jgi:cation diffusion facilitator CzcD-associated flavoprotein CzcO
MASFQWAVVGAGPAGILAVGKLIDAGVDPQSIAWIDPCFKVGDLGQRWSNVSSNTKARLFLDFLKGCQAFQFQQCPDEFEIQRVDPNQTCDLRYVVEPLQWVSDQLSASVGSYTDQVQHIALENRVWQLQLSKDTLLADNVVLAIGMEPKVLPFSGPETISLPEALDYSRLAQTLDPKSTVAVFGSSHSAILVLKNLMACGVKRVINFYLAPLRYAVNMDDWILFDNTGLKGQAAQWAREYLDGQRPENLERVISSTEHLTQYLPECDKVVYAVGFERRRLPVIAGLESVEYHRHSGIIAPGLFGLGIAFPEYRMDPLGHEEYAVGLWKFMDYLNRVLPVWLKYGA